MNCSHHDIVLLPVPFTDLSSSKASGVKSQIATIDTGLVRRVVGRLQPADAATLDANLRQWLNL